MTETDAASGAEPAPRHLSQVIPIRPAHANCVSCHIVDLCWPQDLAAQTLRQLDDLVGVRARIATDEMLYDTGTHFHALLAIRRGSRKTTVLAEGGAQQITGYFLPGDVLGVDGIGSGRHCASACALEDSEVRRLLYVGMEALACEDSRPRPFLLRLLSREVVRGEGMMLALGSMNAQERLAGFLPDLPRRYRLRGYSSTEFVLRFKRCEIGSYLGIKLETVSRLRAQF